MTISSRTIALTVSTVLASATCALAWRAVGPLDAPAAASDAAAASPDTDVAFETTVPSVSESVSVPTLEQMPATSVVPVEAATLNTIPATPAAILQPVTSPTWPSPTWPSATWPSATWPVPAPTTPIVTTPSATVPRITVPVATVPRATVPVVSPVAVTTTVPRTVVTSPPVTAAAPTTTAASRQRYSATGVPVPSNFVIPRSWTKPIPDWPAGCVAGQLEDNGVWNCQR